MIEGVDLFASLGRKINQNIVLSVANDSMWRDNIYPQEEELICNAIDQRKQEFRAGRNCARAVLNQLGVPSAPILRGVNREPLWPTGVVGSISHTIDCCVVACGLSKYVQLLGVDIEVNCSLKKRVSSFVHTEAERSLLKEYSWLPERLIFSAKESLFKCLYPRVGHYFGFQDVELLFFTESNRFSYKVADHARNIIPEIGQCEGYFEFGESYILTMCYVSQEA